MSRSEPYPINNPAHGGRDPLGAFEPPAVGLRRRRAANGAWLQ